MKGVIYQGVRLMPGSRALELHERGDMKALAAHMREVHDAAHKRGEFQAITKR